MKEECVYSKAVSKYGVTAQCNQAKEELAELIVAVSHWQRAKATKLDLTLEMADVSIMLMQLQIMAEISPSAINDAIIIKTDRLKKRLERFSRFDLG